MDHQSRAQQPRFISIEGCDGAGKTTTSRWIYDELAGMKAPVTLVYPKRPHFQDEAVESFMLSMLEELRSPRHLRTNSQWLHLTFTWYNFINEHLVAPALRRGEIVIADTWYHKPLVRYGLMGLRLLEEARSYFDKLVQPDCVCLLDIAPEIAVTRKTAFGFGETGNFEGPREMNSRNFVDYQRRIRSAFQTIAESEGWQIINTEHLSAELAGRQILKTMAGLNWI